MDCPAPIALFRSSFPSEHLYQASSGCSVVLDLQGKWKGEILGAAPQGLAGEVDGHPWTGGGFECQDYSWIARQKQSDLWGWAAWSTDFDLPPAPDSIVWEPPTKEQSGVGWILASDCKIELNGASRPIHIPLWAGQILIPFWSGFISNRPLPWHGSRINLTQVADVSVGHSSSCRATCLKIERSSAIEAEAWSDGTGRLKSGSFLSHLGRASMLLEVPAHAKGLVLRRTFDAFHGLQRSRLLVNGQVSGWWHQTLQDRTHRWAVDDCLIRLDPEFSGGETSLVIEPPAGSPLFSLGRLEVWALNW